MKDYFLYSWKDADRFIRNHRNEWSTWFHHIEVNPVAITIYAKDSCHSVPDILQQLLGQNYDTDQNAVLLDLNNRKLEVVVKEGAMTEAKPPLPLFRDVIYADIACTVQNLPPLERPVIAFHSSKGGAGKTLSLLAFAKAWSEEFSQDSDNRLLLVDGDIVSPGLTLMREYVCPKTFSYLDLLTMIQDGEDVGTIVDTACAKLRFSRFFVETDLQTVTHCFMPDYRYRGQAVDRYATPETIVNQRGNEFILSSILAKICEKSGLGAVLIDLSSGITELSAPLLLDPRVKKYFISSTSSQSVKGTAELLSYVLKGLRITEETPVPEVFLNMVPGTFDNKVKDQFIQNLYQSYPDNSEFAEDVITLFPFADELVHLTDFNQIFRILGDRDLYMTMRKKIHDTYNSIYNHKGLCCGRDVMMQKINFFASRQLSIEAATDMVLMITSPLNNLASQYEETVPTAVMMGAQGSGKTFLHKVMTESFTWGSFCRRANPALAASDNVYPMPVLAACKSAAMSSFYQNRISCLNLTITCANMDPDILQRNVTRIANGIADCADWHSFWEYLLASSINPEFRSFADADTALKQENKKIVFLMDGLEEIFQDISTSANQQKAIQVLCEDIVITLMARYRNLGIIIFISKEMTKTSIRVNYLQFRQIHNDIALNWSFVDSLRLAVWIVDQALEGTFYQGPAISTASRAVIDQNLERLWGFRLGKTSSNTILSSRYILAALSDFNNPPQARDIIRFLKFASEAPARKAAYDDRILMPFDLRFAAAACSREKMKEVLQDKPALRPIFDKLSQLPAEVKLLPLDPSSVNLTSVEENMMISAGFLKYENGRYYFPEMVRQYLGFQYGKGARLKVLSLTLRLY